ncbi:alkyl/aryl-sulfatase [Thermomonospora cellulosilytica]|uniref:Linear primary-alkylsulfatase n=1 Tax=Thermomonospora cellulosilytica TaxID=1411118 RepID=A0A7W3MVS0_9ACTN|nr:alkyl sulfatase dimerization domain-containing protein [Thermomonospora cellulosilytica]MBA9002752.1 alkyl sulfatase BDS1-like metallo-beta-lactamase superfamily hydrolase [Thermomonospora cellulosilytica]
MTDLPFGDRTDFENADRGRIASRTPGIVTNAQGQVVWDGDVFSFLDGECPASVHPSLWRQSQLCAKQGLYEVTEGVYQVRGLDLSNMTLVEGERGVIVIDPLVSNETAAAALALYREHRGDRPVTGLIYTHSHIDHFGGAEGVLPEGGPDGIPILAPEGFTEHAVAENVYAGTAMARRGVYHTGATLPRNPQGMVGTGLGQTASTGTVSLIPPTRDITRTGQEEVIDGVRIVFQITPGTEAPAEMNFHFPGHRALCLAENATHNLHNLLTLRGALVRDARVWSRYLDEAIALFADDTDVAFASHHWPTWGREAIVGFLAEQRDLYAYLHDQTLRMLNQGMTGIEIAEQIELPPALERAWHARGYYGSVSHNVKAVYQRYMGWFDGNPAHLWRHPPVEESRRYLDCMGGASKVLALARDYTAQGDLRFAATLLNHVVFADPDNADAKTSLAEVYQRLGEGAECGTWRNFYLTGAMELRQGVTATPFGISEGMTAGLTTEQLFDSLAIRVNGPKAWNEHLTIDWSFTDTGDRYRTTLTHGALTHRKAPGDGTGANLTVTLTQPQLLGMLTGKGTQDVTTEGDTSALHRLMGVLDNPDPAFPIVTP